MFEFNYIKANSLNDALKSVTEHPEAKLLAGGMTLIPTLKQRLAQPSHLIDIGGLQELTGIAVTGGELVVGAAAKHFDVATSAIVTQAIPALAALADKIGDPQVRNRGTLGGSVANNDPAADYPAAVLALDAVIVTNRREIKAADYFQGMFATALEDGEIILRLRFAIPRRAAYEKFAHPASGYAMAGVFVADMKDGVRVAVTGAASGVFRWTEAEQALAKNMSAEALDGLVVDLGSGTIARRERRCVDERLERRPRLSPRGERAIEAAPLRALAGNHCAKIARVRIERDERTLCAFSQSSIDLLRFACDLVDVANDDFVRGALKIGVDRRVDVDVAFLEHIGQHRIYESPNCVERARLCRNRRTPFVLGDLERRARRRGCLSGVDEPLIRHQREHEIAALLGALRKTSRCVRRRRLG